MSLPTVANSLANWQTHFLAQSRAGDEREFVLAFQATLGAEPALSRYADLCGNTNDR
jgi:hypothetical protein